MLTACAVDVVVAGGGIAGTSVAAALRGSGLEVVVVEPGLDRTKRLAGELIHPPGVTDLADARPEGPPAADERRAGRGLRGVARRRRRAVRSPLRRDSRPRDARLCDRSRRPGGGARRGPPQSSARHGVVGRPGHRRGPPPSGLRGRDRHPGRQGDASPRPSPRRGGRGELPDSRAGRHRPPANPDLPHGRVSPARDSGPASRLRQRLPGRAGARTRLRHRRRRGATHVRRAGQPARNRRAAPGHRVLPRAPRAVPERGEGGARLSAGARVRELLDPARGGVPRPGSSWSETPRGAAIRSPPPASPRPPATPSTSSRRCARLPMCPRPCGATRRSETDRSARAWRSRSLSTGRSATRRPRCGSSAMGSSGSGAGVGGGARRRWRSCRPTRGGCR